MHSRANDEKFFDQAHLVGEAYSDSRNLSSRRDVYRYQEPRVAFPDWALSHLPEDLGSVLDVGCGPGTYFEKLVRRSLEGPVIGIDLSTGMIREALRISALVCVADAQRLPFESEAFDTVICMHVLYHAPDISLAVSELRRVMKMGGRVLVATNGADHQRALRDTFDRAVMEMSNKPVVSVLSSARRFRLEEAEAILSRHFDDVERHDLRAELVFPEAEPVVQYMESIRSFHEDKLPDPIAWSDVMSRFRQKVEGTIAREGSFRTPIHPGVLLCR